MMSLINYRLAEYRVSPQEVRNSLLQNCMEFSIEWNKEEIWFYPDFFFLCPLSVSSFWWKTRIFFLLLLLIKVTWHLTTHFLVKISNFLQLRQLLFHYFFDFAHLCANFIFLCCYTDHKCWLFRVIFYRSFCSSWCHL